MGFFNEEFFPTPPELAEKMLDGLEFGYRDTILEPSAGKGDLIEAIKEKAGYQRFNEEGIDAIEIDPELQHILKGKEIRIVHNNFLTFETLMRYDWIIMNPPFSNGDAHLAKALNFLKPGGICVCLLNAETIRKPHTKLRKALKQQLQEWGYEKTFVSGAFKNAERPTDVEVVIIKVQCPETVERVSILLDGLKRAEEQEESRREAPRSLIDNNPIRAAISQCRLEQKLGLTLIAEYEAMKPYILERIPRNEEENKYNQPLFKIDIKPNAYIRAVRKKYWEALFRNPCFIDQLTSNLQRELYNNVDEMRYYDFNEVNILALQTELSRKIIDGVKATIVELFDELSRKYHWQDETSTNIHYFNGWKTNKSWKINRKVIIPLRALSSHSWGSFNFEWHAKEKLCDMEKCLDFLNGNRMTNVSTANRLHLAERCGQTRKIILKHIQVTLYKKGTAHIEFLNQDLLDQLNIFGCQQKNWLPPGYGKTAYEDLDEEARSVVDSFQGEADYRETCHRNDLFLDQVESMPRLALTVA
jgi:hypothetical protein